jgi:hypothetical protein
MNTEKIKKAHEELKNEYDRVMDGVDPNNADAVCNAFISNLLANNSPLAGKLDNWYNIKA